MVEHAGMSTGSGSAQAVQNSGGTALSSTLSQIPIDFAGLSTDQLIEDSEAWQELNAHGGQLVRYLVHILLCLQHNIYHYPCGREHWWFQVIMDRLALKIISTSSSVTA